MKRLVFPLLFLLTLSAFSQKVYDEFMPTIIGDKEAFLSTKTGEFVYREHAKTDVSAMYTSASGTVIYEERIAHAVKKGETLSAIAKKRGVSITELKSQNKLKSNNLSIGQQLKVVKKQVVPSSKPVINKPEGKIIARLAPGQRPGSMTPPDLPPDAMPGSTINLVVEGDAKTPAKTPVNEKAENVVDKINEDGSVNHTVKSGETLFSIARKYKVSITDLKKENNLALNTISPGQKLKVKVYNAAVFNQNTKPLVTEEKEQTPKEEMVTEEIEVVEEPTIKKVEEIKEEVVENVEDNTEEVKEIVEEKIQKPVVEKKTEIEEIVEKKREAVVAKNPKVKEVDAKEEQTKALIKKYKKKETPVVEKKPDAVISSTSTVLSKGSIEKSQTKTSSQDANEERTKALIERYKKKEVAKPEIDKASVYVVKKGDTLWSIAKRVHVSIKDLKELNKLTSDALSIGQELKIK